MRVKGASKSELSLGDILTSVREHVGCVPQSDILLRQRGDLDVICDIAV